MRDTRTTDDEMDAAEAPTRFVNYLPGMPGFSDSPGRVQRFLTRLFRRRGELPAFRRRD